MSKNHRSYKWMTPPNGYWRDTLKNCDFNRKIHCCPYTDSSDGLILIGLNFTHSLYTVARTADSKSPAYLVFISLLVGSLELVGVALWKFIV